MGAMRKEWTRRAQSGIVAKSISLEERTMKILFFDDWKLGVLKGDTVVDVSDAVKDIPRVGPHDVINGLIARFADYRGKLQDAAAKGTGVPLSRVRIRPPLPRPTTIVAMAV